MGHIVHHTIVVTTWDDELAKRARKKAKKLGNRVTNITDGVITSYLTFCVVPDGSKSGWGASNEGDQARLAFKKWLGKQAFSDGSTALSWVEVEFGDDESSKRAWVVDDSNQQIMRNPAAHESGIV